MGYEMYRLLTSRKVKTNYKQRKNAKASKEPGVIDLVQEEKDQDLLVGKYSDRFVQYVRGAVVACWAAGQGC